MLRENRFSESRCRRYQSSTVMIPFLVIATLLNILLGVLALKKGFHTSVNRWFAVLCFSIAVWIFANFFLHPPFSEAFLAVKMTFLSGNVAIVSSLMWSLVFSGVRVGRSHIAFAYMSTALFNIWFFFSDSFILYNSARSDKWEPSEFFIIYSAIVAIILLTSIFYLVKKYLSSTGLEKSRSFLILSSLALMASIVFLVVYLLPSFGYYQIINLDIYTVTFFIVFLYYAVMKYEFLNIRIILRKTLIYTLTSFILFLFMGVIVYKFSDTFIQVYSLRPKDLYFAVFVFFILLMSPLQFVVRKIVDKFIFSEKIDLFHATNKAGFLESKSQDLRDYSEKAREFMMQKMHAFDCELLIWDEDEKQYQQYYQSGRHIVLLPSDPVLQILQRAKRHFFTEDLRRYAEQEGLEPEVIKTCLRKLHALNASIVVPLIVHDALLGLFLINVDTKDIDISDIQISGFAIEVSRGLSACLLMNYRDYIKI